MRRFMVTLVTEIDFVDGKKLRSKPGATKSTSRRPCRTLPGTSRCGRSRTSGSRRSRSATKDELERGFKPMTLANMRQNGVRMVTAHAPIGAARPTSTSTPCRDPDSPRGRPAPALQPVRG